MNFDNFIFRQQHGSYTLSLLEYLTAVQQSSQHFSIQQLEYKAREIDLDGVANISNPDIYIQREHKINIFNQADTDYEAAYLFTGAGDFLYYISQYPSIDRIVTQMEFLRRMHDELYACMGVDNPFIDNRGSSYKVIFDKIDGVVKLFHILHYDTGFKAVFDQSFNITDLYFKQQELEKFKDYPLDKKKIIFAFFNVYFRSQLLRQELHKKYHELTFEEIRDYLTLYRMVNI